MDVLENLKIVATGRSEFQKLGYITRSTNPGFESTEFKDKTRKAVDAFVKLIGLNNSPYDGATNQKKIWKQLMLGTLGVEIPFWQFVCPKKTRLRGSVWEVLEDPNYDILTPSLDRTEEVNRILRDSDLPYRITIFYPDDEILKARASGLKLDGLVEEERNRLKLDLDEISLNNCLELEVRVKYLADVEMWSEVYLKLGIDTNLLFAKELDFWKFKGTLGVGFFKETQNWLAKTFKFSKDLAFELTARRLAKYAVEGICIAKLYTQGSIYLNNEFPYNEPWAMYQASLTPEDRAKMASLFYLGNKS